MVDKNCKELCDMMNSLPGIEVDSGSDGDNKYSYSIFFKVKDYPHGLFVLVRSVDRRYWRYGNFWHIELSVGDSYDDNYLPVIYHLYSDEIGEKARYQLLDLVDNIKHHLKHEAFMKLYDLDIMEWKNISRTKLIDKMLNENKENYIKIHM